MPCKSQEKLVIPLAITSSSQLPIEVKNIKKKLQIKINSIKHKLLKIKIKV